MSAVTALQLPVVNVQRGQEIKRRRASLGIANLSEFERASDIPRKTLANVEEGTASERSFLRVEKWLTDFEHETGHDVPEVEAPVQQAPAADAGLVHFKVGGNFGVDVVVSGPVSNMPELEAAVGRLLDRLKSDGGGTGSAQAG